MTNHPSIYPRMEEVNIEMTSVTLVCVVESSNRGVNESNSN